MIWRYLIMHEHHNNKFNACSMFMHAYTDPSLENMHQAPVSYHQARTITENNSADTSLSMLEMYIQIVCTAIMECPILNENVFKLDPIPRQR